MPEKRKGIFRRLTEAITGGPRDIPTALTEVKELNKIKETKADKIVRIDEEQLEKAKDLARTMDVGKLSVGFKTITANEMEDRQLYDIYRQMDSDSVISAALDLFADNTTQINTKTGHVVSVESPDKLFEEEINEFLWDTVKMDTEAWNITRSIAKYGKVVLDTKASNGGRDWAFIEVESPEYVLPLTYGQDNIKYYAVTKDPNAMEPQNTGTSYGVTQMQSNNNSGETKIEESNRYIAGFNARKHLGKMVIEKTHPITNETTAEELYIRGGKSFLEGIIDTWRVLSTLEDSLFISRLVKSKAFNIVTIDISDSDNKQGRDMVESVKRAIKSSETIDAYSNRYQNRTSPIPANDFIYVPVKGEKGVVTIEQVGGEIGTQDLEDIDYFRNKLFAGLGVLKAYLGLEESTPGGLGETSLTMLDERFTRKVKRLRNSLVEVNKQIIEYYWVYSDTKRNLDNLPKYKVVLGKLSSQEERADREELESNIGLANDILGLANAFPDKVDQDKMFNYLFNNIIGIDPANFDTAIDAKEIQVYGNQLDETRVKEIVRDTIKRQTLVENLGTGKRRTKRVKANSEDTVMIEGTVKSLLENVDMEAFLKEHILYLIDENGKEILFHDALENKELRNSLTEATYKDLKRMSRVEDPERIRRSKKIYGKYTGIDENNYITFVMTAQDPEKNKAEGKPTSYEFKTELKAIYNLIKSRQAGETDLNLVRDAVAGDIAVSCSCPAAKYWGMQYRGTKEGYSLVKNNVAPTKIPPVQPICKHTASALTLLPFYSNTIVKDLRKRGLLTTTSKAKKDEVETPEIELVDEVVDNKETKEITKEEKLAKKAPKTVKKKKQVEEEQESEAED